jgi:hypothetical protein
MACYCSADGDGDVDAFSFAQVPQGSNLLWLENLGNSSFTPHLIAEDVRASKLVENGVGGVLWEGQAPAVVAQVDAGVDAWDCEACKEACQRCAGFCVSEDDVRACLVWAWVWMPWRASVLVLRLVW